MKNDKRIDLSTNHQIALLEKYYDVDRTKKEINVKLYYDKASELLNFSVGDIGKEMFDNSVLEKITEITDQFPSDYRANIIFVVTDFEGYTVELLNEKLIDIIDINNFKIIKNRKYTWLTAAILVLVGFVLLLTLGMARHFNWFGDGIKKEVFEEMLNITSWVFIWQAVTILFLQPSNLSKIGFKIIRSINSVSFMDKNLNYLSKLSKDDVIENWESDSRTKSYRKVLLLVSSTAIFALGLYKLSQIIVDLITVDKMDGLSFLSYMVDVILILSYTFAGLAGFYKYLNKNKFRKFAKFFSVILGLVILFSIVGSIISFQVNTLISNLISLLVYGVYIFSIYAPDSKKIKENKENQSN